MQSVITSKFQTTIPKGGRESLKLTINDTLEWKIERGKTVVIPVKKSTSKLQKCDKNRQWKDRGRHHIIS